MGQFRGVWTVCAAALALLCIGLLAAGEGDAGPRVVIGVRGDVDSLNIYTASTILSQEVANLLFLPLAVERDDFADGPPSFEPSLARTWATTPDGLTIEFQIDKTMRWSDGRPVTSRDVVFSHEAAVSAQVGWVGKDVKDSIESVTAVDPLTVRFRFRRRHPYQLMDAVEGNVIPEHHYAAIPFASWPATSFISAPVVSGPYRLASYRPGEAIVLERNPAHAGTPAGLPRVIFRVLPDVATLLAELESGGIDVMENVPAAQVERLRSNPRLELTTLHDLSYTFVCWNLRSPLFAEPRVRRALTMAIDRQAIVDGILFGNGRTLASPILSLFWAHDPSITPHPHDPPAARRLLGEAGWSDADGDGILDKEGRPFRFVLETNQGSQLRHDVAVMVQDHLRKVGIDAQPRVLEWRTFLQKHDAHDFEAFVGGHREATRVDLTSLLHSSAIEGGYNHAGYSSRTMDDLIEQARMQSDTALARRLWSSAQRLFHEDQPFTVLFEMQRVNAVNRRVTDVRMSPRSAFGNLPRWRLREDPSKPAP
ncbi:MAG TPA: ABC transporter substrate-binding protein, partial [Candidatus Polarisedimenticolia bacterium]|nr:ABC transporter substrate-binding protein [Candidatus Polarisedimenticolia bacterium]